jgi:hypothetical protein
VPRPARHQRQRDDAHGLLRIVGTVREAHGAGAEDLCLAEEAIDPARPRHAPEHPPLDAMPEMIANSRPMHQEAGDEAQQRRVTIGTTTFHSTPALFQTGPSLATR